MEWNRTNVAWMAGLLEGEGYFGVQIDKRTDSPRIEMTCVMTDEDVIDKLHTLIPWARKYVVERPPHKTQYRLMLMRKARVYALCAALFPFMGERRQDQLRAVMDTFKAMPGTGNHHRVKTHCPSGHPYDDANTYEPNSGGRHCRACRTRRDKARV